MREIKFRAWEKSQRRMLIPDGLRNPVNFSTNVEHMQFTGLRDKNGKEIYEGDVLKREMDYKQAAVDDEFFEVSWGNGFWKGCRLYEEAEVLGNIYENPELLA